jgi:hypothetical protein
VLKVKRPGFLSGRLAVSQTTVGTGVTTAAGLPDGDGPAEPEGATEPEGAADPEAAAEAVALADGAVEPVALGAVLGLPVAAVPGAVVGDGVDAAGEHAISARLAVAVRVRTRRIDIYGSS